MDEAENVIFLKQTDAIRSFILSCTAPFLVETPGDETELFTGTFMTFCERYFVVTVGHAFTDRLGKDINIFTRHHPDNKDLHSIGPHLLSVSSSEDVDVGIIELKDQEAIKIFKQNWRFLTIDNVTRSLHNSSTIIVGFPTAKTRDNAQKEFDPKSIFIKTELLDGNPPPEIKRTEGLDFFVQFGRVAQTLDREPIETVDVHGMSGAAVWQYRNSTSDVWCPSRSFKIVGIQVRMATSKSFLRALNWWAIAASFKKIDPEFEVILTRYLDSADAAEGVSNGANPAAE